MKRGRLAKEYRRNRAIELAKNPNTSRKPFGLREKVRHGIVSLSEAISTASEYNENIRGWLSRRKKANIKPKQKKSPEKKKNKKDVQKNKKKS